MRTERRVVDRRITWTAALLSISAHALVLLSPSGSVGRDGAPGRSAVRFVQPPFGGTEVVRLREVGAQSEHPTADVPEVPRRDDGTIDDASERAVVAPVPVVARVAPERLPAADELGPSLSSPGLWRMPSELGALVDGFEPERQLARSRITSLNAATMNAPRRVVGMSAWTRGDRDARWGLSPGFLHLGSVALPTCLGGGANAADCGFGLLPNRRLAYAGRLAEYDEMALQAHTQELKQIEKERARAIRARRDAERADTLHIRRH